jgi:hypothetical protein
MDCTMKKKKRKKLEKLRKEELKSCEHRSDKRTAEFVVRRLGGIQEELSDLIPDLRTFEHYDEIENLSWSLRLLQRIKDKYQGFADRGVWEDTD